MLGIAKKALKRMTIWDIQCVKLSAFFFGFFVAAFLSESFLYNYRWLWLAIALLAALKPMYTTFYKKK